MEVRVAGHQVETGHSLQSLAQERMAEIAEKFFSRAVGATVTFGRGAHNEFTCDIIAPVAQGMVLKASHHAPRAEQALAGAADRIETQLRKYSKKLSRHKGFETQEPFVENADYIVFKRDDAPSDEGDAPTIVAENKVDIPVSSVSSAVMLMDLRNTPALMFRNSRTGEFNMIYRREDGNIGWVEPHKG